MYGETRSRHRTRRTVRDYAYAGYPAHYDAFNPLAAPGDTVLLFLTGPRVFHNTPLTFPLDSVQTLIADAVTGDTVSIGWMLPPFADTLIVNDTLFAMRPQPGDSIALQGRVRLYAGGQDSLVVSGNLTLYSDSLVFPILSDSITIDTLGFSDASDPLGDFVTGGGAWGFGADRGELARDFSTTNRDDVGLGQAVARRVPSGRDTGHNRPTVRAWERDGDRYARSVPATGGRLNGRDGVLSTVHEPRRPSPKSAVRESDNHVLLAGVSESQRFGGRRYVAAGGSRGA